ncbi:uncharacterized protein C2845_PM05G04620 [Panicum miliaceum]|uniref:Mitochondrial import inner membrane translocase subunit TIM50 n=1 Tax=Panicum miliaceum TaxID=4540 RepID=A0A3L6SU85_PANMI|nr:uncharacterized protein C2845_PM05G04620 [Panicum miliaceum]
MSGIKHTARRESGGEGSEPPRRPGKDHGKRRKKQSKEELAGKDKGKAMEEPHKKKKKYREQRDMQRAVAASDAADAARVGGRAGAFRIMDPDSQEEQSPPRRRSTRGRASPDEMDAPPTTRSGRKRACTEGEAELDAEPEALLHPTWRLIQVPINSSASWVKKKRFMSLEEWFVEPRDDDAGRDFYTLLQAGFYRAYELRGIQLSKHNVLVYRRLTQAAGGDSTTAYMVYRPPPSMDPRRGPRALVAAQSGMAPQDRAAAIEEDDIMEDLDVVHGLWDDYDSDDSDSDSDYGVSILAPPPRAHDAEAGAFSPRQSLKAFSKKKLLILDLNGVLEDINTDNHNCMMAVGKVQGKLVFRRPYCDEFLDFCAQNFEDMSKCTVTMHKTLENRDKPLVLKEMRKLWQKEDPDLPWEEGDYSPSNTLLVDDSPYKALRNPGPVETFACICNT